MKEYGTGCKYFNQRMLYKAYILKTINKPSLVRYCYYHFAFFSTGKENKSFSTGFHEGRRRGKYPHNVPDWLK